MTDNVEKLHELVDEGLDFFGLTGDEGDKLYVRAIRQHIAAKDVEIEALRAEVKRLKALVRSVGYETLDRAEQAEALAERLAEALRRYRTEVPLGHQPHMIAHEVDALLNSIAAQENDDA